MCAVCGRDLYGFVGVSVSCVGQFGVGLWVCVCALCGRVWCEFVGVSVC